MKEDIFLLHSEIKLLQRSKMISRHIRIQKVTILSLFLLLDWLLGSHFLFSF